MQWHELLGAVLTDFFEGSPYAVDTEIDLSLMKQYLDIGVIRRREGDFDRPLPDGFAPLADFNLISFKSHQETFDWWTVLELLGHYVNYRKQASPSVDALLPVERFRLFGIAARFPDKLAKEIRLEESQPGVYDINVGPTRIRLLVIRNLLNEPDNALLKLFSIVPDQVEFACHNYQARSLQTTGIVDNLIRMYRKEDLKMAKTIEDIAYEVIQKLPPEQRLKGLSAEERLKGLPAEERLKGLPAEERLKGLAPAEIEAYLQALKKKKTKRK